MYTCNMRMKRESWMPQVRIHEGERLILEERAEKAGYSVADYMRSREGFETEHPPRRVTKAKGAP